MRIRNIIKTIGVVSVAGCCLAAVSSFGQATGAALPNPDIRFEQKLNAQIPLNLRFRDSTGSMVDFGSYFDGKPVVLALVYYECPMLCTLILNGMVESLSRIQYEPAEDFQIVAVSIDHEETHLLAAGKKEQYLEVYGRPDTAEGWHFLVGEQDQIEKLADAVGYRFKYDAKTDEYAHGSGIVVATEDGVISRMLPGIVYEPRDLRLSLVEASRRQIGTIIDKLSLICFRYDHVTGEYSFYIMNILRIASAITIAVLGTMMFVLLRREKRAMRAIILKQT
jgi:protein SCO1/2